MIEQLGSIIWLQVVLCEYANIMYTCSILSLIRNFDKDISDLFRSYEFAKFFYEN